MPQIESLNEVEPNRWVAKYRGNYGTYTIRLTIGEDGCAAKYSCSCPSSGSPCKHIGMILEAIPERSAEQKAVEKEDGDDLLSPAKILAEVSEKELRAFVISQAKQNAEFRKSFIMEFAPKTKSKAGANPYAQIIREELAKVDFEDTDEYWYDSEAGIRLNILDEMVEKAIASIANAQYDEAIMIAKACLEEYAAWAKDSNLNASEYVGCDYAESSLQILRDAVEKGGCDPAALYEYCKARIDEPRFDFSMKEALYDLMLVTAMRTKNHDFIETQEKLLAELSDSSSYEIVGILAREIEFYSGVDEPAKADAIIMANLHIERFRKTAVDKLIATGQYDEAKRLIALYPQNAQRRGGDWDVRLLEIARRENDVPSIREYAWRFIEDGFHLEYYRIYKSAFTVSEWTAELERIVDHYSASRGRFSGNVIKNDVANVLAEEKLEERLLVTLEKNPNPYSVEEFYKHCIEGFPERTLALFRRAVDQYTANNVGTEHYGTIAKWLRVIRRLPGGVAVCEEMLADYRITYKRRTAMMRTLREMFRQT